MIHKTDHTGQLTMTTSDIAADPNLDRREFLRSTFRGIIALAVGGTAAVALSKSQIGNTVWQLDPSKCVQCGQCATHCVLSTSAVKCMHAYNICGYCNLCGGYHRPGASAIDTAAENQLCPTGALKRTFVEDPFYEYTIDESLCIGCAKCVKGCSFFGNGSLFLQVNHDLCSNCNDCAIARKCQGNAFRRVPAKQPYLSKS
jgi:electron transport complex protein RnfB